MACSKRRRKRLIILQATQIPDYATSRVETTTACPRVPLYTLNLPLRSCLEVRLGSTLGGAVAQVQTTCQCWGNDAVSPNTTKSNARGRSAHSWPFKKRVAKAYLAHVDLPPDCIGRLL